MITKMWPYLMYYTFLVIFIRRTTFSYEVDFTYLMCYVDFVKNDQIFVNQVEFSKCKYQL